MKVVNHRQEERENQQWLNNMSWWLVGVIVTAAKLRNFIFCRFLLQNMH